jgi:hypothetical protein
MSELDEIRDALTARGIPATGENIALLRQERARALDVVELEAKLTPDYIMSVLNQHTGGLTIKGIFELLGLAENEETRRKLGVVLGIMEWRKLIKRELVNGDLRNIPCKEKEC